MGIVVRSFWCLFCLLLLVTPIAWAANMNSSQKFAWGENVGWITLEGVTVSSSALTGYAWGENVGWISLDCNNTSSCGTVNYGVQNNGSGTVSGYAWGENTGWVSFSCTNTSSCGTVNYGVTINTSNGRFSGYAWGENVGWIVFSCATTSSCATVDYRVTTSLYSSAAGSSTSGGGGGINPVFLVRPEGLAQITINGGASTTVSPAVALTLTAGTNVRRMAVSNYSDFRDSIQEPYQLTKNWYLLPMIATETPLYRTTGVSRTVYVRYFTDQGQPSALISASIRLVAEIRKGVATQPLPSKSKPKPAPPSPARPIGPTVSQKQPPLAAQPPALLSPPPLPALELRPRPAAPPNAVEPEHITFKSVGPPRFLPAARPSLMARIFTSRSFVLFNIIGIIALTLITLFLR